jgi:hypothetical protein
MCGELKALGSACLPVTEKVGETDDRFNTVTVPITSVALSTGQSDSGMFERDFAGFVKQYVKNVEELSQDEGKFSALFWFAADDVFPVVALPAFAGKIFPD